MGAGICPLSLPDEDNLVLGRRLEGDVGAEWLAPTTRTRPFRSCEMLRYALEWS